MSDYIPEDNLLVIFKQLPVKTLLRFRCVCKDWKQFIDSPTFSQLHLSIQNPRFIVDLHQPNKYVVVDPQPDPLVHNLSKPETENYLLLVGTLHGVVCLYDFKNLVLWNPSLRKFWSRPFPSSFEWYEAPLMNSYGFWIDPSTKEFKAIMLQQKPVQKCIMYSSIREDWSEIPTRNIAKWNPCSEGPPVMVGGAGHWGGCLDSIIDGRHHRYRYYHSHHKEKAILSFDFVHESFDIIELPYLQSWGWEYAPCRWQGTLSVVCWDRSFPCGFEIYSRQEDSWVKMVGLKVDDTNILCVFGAMEDVEGNTLKEDVEYLQRMDDLYGKPQENVKVLGITNRVSGELFFHGTKTGFRVLRKGRGNYEVVMAYDFVESLLFP